MRYLSDLGKLIADYQLLVGQEIIFSISNSFKFQLNQTIQNKKRELL
jgi:hypothetical protein